jgi:hypothetical protein
MSELYLDFSEVEDYEAIVERLLSLFQEFGNDVRFVEATIHTNVAGSGATHRDWNVMTGADLNSLADHIAKFIADYAEGKHGRHFSGATVSMRLPI